MTKQPDYSPMLQGVGSNKFTQVNTRSTQPIVDIFSNTDTATIALDEKWQLQIKGYGSSTNIRTSTHKLLNAAIIELTKNNNYKGADSVRTKVYLQLEDFMRDCGIPLTKPSKDKTRQRIKEDLEALYSCSLSWVERRGKSNSSYMDVRLISSKGIKNNVIEMGFSPEFAEYLVNSYVMPFPKALLQIDERNPSAFILGKKLALRHSMNNKKQEDDGDHNTISVKALLAECSQTIPSYETVMSGDKCVKDRIKKPFESALNALGYITWEYLTQEKELITKEQADKLKFLDYVKLYVRFVMDS